MNSRGLSKRIKAFTIPEVILSAFLLTTGILTVMSLFSASHRSAIDTRQVIIASLLAQEGVEIARNIRDNAIATKAETGDSSYDVFTDFPNGAASRRTVSYNSASFTTPGSIFLSWDGSGFQRHGAGTFTGFWRILKIDHTGSSDTTARVQSFVVWSSSGPGSNLNGAGATTWCSPYNKCVYTELLLTAWK